MKIEIKPQSIENNKTTISIGVPLTEKIYSTSFNVKESILRDLKKILLVFEFFVLCFIINKRWSY